MTGNDDGDSKGPSLGRPTPPSSVTGPQGPSLGGPSLGSGPSLGPTSQPSPTSSTPVNVQKNRAQKSKVSVNRHEIIRRYKVAQRRVQRSLQTLMSFEFKTKVGITSLNFLYRDFIQLHMEGQIKYHDEKIKEIEKGEDELSQELMEEDLDNRASTQAFESISEIVKDELDRFLEEKPLILELIEEDLNRYKDARLEPRACFWILVSTGLQLQQIKSKEPKAFEIVMNVLIRYKPALKRGLAIMLHFCNLLIEKYPPLEIESARIILKPGPTGTGYNLAPWIKYRYGTNSQSSMEYEEFLQYFVRSFGKVSGNSPEFEGGPKWGYKKWIQRTLEELENVMRTSTYLVENARGDSFEGMVIGLKDELEQELKDREYDNNGKLINQPQGAEGVIKFLEWLFETGIQRYTTTNFASHKEVRLSIEMFDYLEDTIRWVNEYGERIVVDWLDEDVDDETEEEENLDEA